MPDLYINVLKGNLSTENKNVKGNLNTNNKKISGGLSLPKSVTVTDYNTLSNKPQINDVEVIGNKSIEDYGVKTMTNIEIKQIFDRIFNKGGN